MEQQAVEAAAIAGSVSGDLSILSLVARADFIVKLVLVLLLGSSIWSWAIIFDKVRRLRRVSTKASEFEEVFWSGGSLEDLYDRIGTKADHPMALLFASAMREWRRSGAHGLVESDRLSTGVQERIGQVMRLTIARDTAFGLVAAIPAVVAYNKFSSDLNRFSGRLEGFAGEFSAILSRQLDERTD